MWNQDKELLVKGDHLDQVVIKGDTVYVPKGRTVEGNLTVKGGSIDVEGDIQGNLVVIGGSANLASTAKVGSYVKKSIKPLRGYGIRLTSTGRRFPNSRGGVANEIFHVPPQKRRVFLLRIWYHL